MCIIKANDLFLRSTSFGTLLNFYDVNRRTVDIVNGGYIQNLVTSRVVEIFTCT